VEDFVKRLVTKMNIDENLYSNILISLTEAVNNAMIHGNQLDNKKTIVVSFKKQGHRIIFLFPMKAVALILSKYRIPPAMST
jgi:serine/threonine-protein kinase RsbW